MCFLCKEFSVNFFYMSHTIHVYMHVCVRHLADCGIPSTCVLFPSGTQAQVHNVPFTLMCHQSGKLEASQSATFPTHCTHHVWKHAAIRVCAVNVWWKCLLSHESLHRIERRISSNPGLSLCH